MLKMLFITVSLIFAILMAIYKLFICKLKRTPKISVFVSVIAGSLVVFLVTAIIFAVMTEGVLNKIVAILLAGSPFIIGKFATYEKENLYSWLQIGIVLAGILYFVLL